MSHFLDIAVESYDVDDSLTDINSIIEDHNLLYTNKDLHSTISVDLSTLTNMENEFHNQLVISTEAYQNKTIALESIISTLKEFWAKIVAFIKSIIEKIVVFFQNHFGLLSRRKKHILQLIEDYSELDIGTIKHEVDNKPIELTDVHYLFVDGKGCNNGDNLLDGIKGLVKETNFIFNNYLSSVIKRGEIIETSINHIKNNKDDSLYKKFTTDIIQHGFEEFEIKLLGNTSMTLWKPLIEEDNSFPANVKRIADTNVIITDTVEIPRGKIIQFENIEVSKAKIILAELLTLIEEFESFNKTRFKEILKLSDRIRDDSDTLMNRIESMFNAKSDDPDTHKQIASIKALIGLNPAYIRWVKTPTTDIIDISTDCIFHIGLLLSKNLEKYNKRTALNIFSVIGVM